LELPALLVELVSESLDFFLEAQFAFLELGDHQIVWVRAVQLVLDQFVEFVMLVRQFLKMRLKAHVSASVG
jgi:hypothetical protein